MKIFAGSSYLNVICCYDITQMLTSYQRLFD